MSLAIVPGGRDCMLSGATAAIEEVGRGCAPVTSPLYRFPVAHPFHSDD